MPLHVIDSDQGPALGSAMHAAVAAGLYPDIQRGRDGHGQGPRATPTCPTRRAPTPTTRSTRTTSRLHDHFGRGGDDVMHRLRDVRPRELAGMSVDAIRRESCAPARGAPRNGLVVWTSGNLSARVPGAELMVIKPSGVPYDGTDARGDGGLRPRRRRGRGPLEPVQRRRDPRLHLPRSCRTSAGSRTPTAPTRPRGRCAGSRSRA